MIAGAEIAFKIIKLPKIGEGLVRGKKIDSELSGDVGWKGFQSGKETM